MASSRVGQVGRRKLLWTFGGLRLELFFELVGASNIEPGSVPEAVFVAFVRHLGPGASLNWTGTWPIP